jgi:hypothetical protein
MLDLFEEFTALIATLESAGVEYAVCGGMAMAIHGFPRATVDVDLLVPPSSTDAAIAHGRNLGFTFPADPMIFAGGKIQIQRMTKIDRDSGDILSLDLLLVGPATTEVWGDRQRVRWEQGELWVVSKTGLVALKRMRGSGQDQDDINHLEGIDP